jgi:hypothetical protein
MAAPRNYVGRKMETPVDFDADIREFVLSSLPHDQSLTEELRAKQSAELLIIYGNWHSRLISLGPRHVERSHALDANFLSSDPRYKPGLDSIIAKLETGEDLTSHLSRGIRHGYRPSVGSNGNRQDLDLLLNDWGVHHLHLSTVFEADGFVKRTGPLLFAAFKPDRAFLIDIVDHGGWTRDSILQTIISEWPNEQLVWELKGVLAPRQGRTEADRRDLRNAHISSFFEMNGKMYAPAGGLTTAGTSTRNTLSVQRLLRQLKWLEQQISSDAEYLNKASLSRGTSLPTNPDLHFEFFQGGGYGIVERQTGLRFVLG